MKSRSQNPIYIATTISVYIGLVIVGASPSVLASSDFARDAQSRVFELTSRSGSVLSKLKLRQENSQEEFPAFPLAFFETSFITSWAPERHALVDVPKASTPIFRNEQTLTVSVLPRASI